MKNPQKFIDHCHNLMALLGLEAAPQPIDVLAKLNAISATVGNPVSRAFQTAITVADKFGNPINITWVDQEHVELALENECWPLIQIYLEARRSKPTGAAFLSAYALDEAYKEAKPLGFFGTTGDNVPAARVKATVSATLKNWQAFEGDIEFTSKTKKASSKEKELPYLAEVDAIRKRVAAMQAQSDSS